MNQNENDIGINRRAKLFEAGEYPDKGVSVSRRDLLRLAANFDTPVPVLIEHGESPLQLGKLIEVEPVGDELFGTIQLSVEANALLEQNGARHLSLGLSPDMTGIREVSIVRYPRVESAQLFGDSVQFSVGILEITPSVQSGDSEAEIQRLLREGRLLPSQLPLVRALFASQDSVEFGADRLTVKQIARAFLQRQPPHSLFTQIATNQSNTEDAAEHLMLPEEAAFYRRHFPNISLAQIAQRR